jgi:site-specific DNA recombinase
MRLKAVIYCRVSTDKQEVDGESLEYQEAKCRQYAELHDYEVVLVLLESKSGFIHYSLREKLTLARQMIREHAADVIIVFDLRRFARNFVHSAMIFQEVEDNGGQIVSVSENIDNSLTGKLIRSILAWSAESEREKIVEYANRHWQTRLEHNLPMGTGRTPYGWQWGDKDKTFYMVNHEEAAVRFSMFHMFVELDMSVRAIAHKLTEDSILPPALSRGHNVKSSAWQPSTVHMLLTDTVNIGMLTLCKTTTVMTAKGPAISKSNGHTKVIPNGLPAIIPIELYERAQRKLKTNRQDKSHRYAKPEDFLLKGHVFCKTCDYRMAGVYMTARQKYTYPFYRCDKFRNKYDACPDRCDIRTTAVDVLVWQDCCKVFERIEAIRDTIERNIEQSLQNMLEDTKGRALIRQTEQEIQQAKLEQHKHDKDSYTYSLIAADIQHKQETLVKYEVEYAKSRDAMNLSDVYKHSILDFLNFLDVMRGKYHEATYQEKRNALEVLGVKVSIYPKQDRDELAERVEITYTPVFTGVQLSFG